MLYGRDLAGGPGRCRERSPAQFLAGGVSDIVAAALKDTGFAPHRLELEITETLLLGD